MKKISVLIMMFIITSAVTLKAQEENTDTIPGAVGRIASDLELLKRIKLSGYMQAQFQWADSMGQSSFAGGNFVNISTDKVPVDKRFMLRRARLKVQYDGAVNEKGWSTSQYVFQFDVTEKGLTIKDMYAKFTDPWSGWFSITAGMQNRPFGYEIGYSSSLRESPERGRLSQTIFPNERDLGAMVTIQGPKISRWNWIKLEVGMFNGTGGPGASENTSDFDKYKDFIGRLGISRSTPNEKIKWGIGGSYYDGGFVSDSTFVYTPGQVDDTTFGFIKSDEPVKKGTMHKRTHVGGDAQLSIDWVGGITTIRGEYIQGDQPGTSKTSKSPINLPAAADGIYNRKFNGAYFYFIQNILSTPFQAIVKYDWYDPNTDIAGDDIGKPGSKTNSQDIKFTTIGVGLAYRWDANLKLVLYYDMVENETSKNLSGYTRDIKDNVVTLRAQMKF